uniref:Retrotransposon gag domain-containing protein n=1 Tax=Brassica oleracea var. oleracea TaxID=109376 RepID=A0A0D3BKX7_BRAOL
MESYLVSEDLWDVVGGNNTTPPRGNAATPEATKEWTRKNAKAEFALKRSISSSIFEHVSRCTSASSIWQALDQLFNKKNEAKLQLLENELADAKQGESSISEFFIKVKNLCSEINTLNPEESISEARLKRSIIRGLRPEYTPVQGWDTQPCLEEFENLLASQESLAMQMSGVKINDDSGSAFKVLDGTIEALEVRSEDNIADIFTKSLPKGQFETLRSKLGMMDKIKFKGEY